MTAILEFDPNWVRPGWTPLLVVAALAVVLVFLFFSMRRQLRKIDIPGDPRGERDPDEGPADPASPPEQPTRHSRRPTH